jgi:energy-coupling factor transporter ATP-binding protein EcfA2
MPFRASLGEIMDYTNDFYEVLKGRMKCGNLSWISVNGDRGQGKSSVALQMSGILFPKYKRIRVVWK